MGLTLAQKLIKSHLVEGEMIPGKEIGLRIDQTLTQDATGTMAYLEFQAMGVDRVKTERSVAYIDHNTLQTGFENADDHRYIQTVTKKHGIYFSRPGNESAIRFILSVSEFPAKRSSALTATLLQAAVSACLLWAPAALTLQLPWAAAHTTFLCPQ